MSQKRGFGNWLSGVFGGGRGAHAPTAATSISSAPFSPPRVEAMPAATAAATQLSTSLAREPKSELPIADGNKAAVTSVPALASAALGEDADGEHVAAGSQHLIASASAAADMRVSFDTPDAVESPAEVRAELTRMLAILSEGATFFRPFAQADVPVSVFKQEPLEYLLLSDEEGVRLRLVKGSPKAMPGGVILGGFGVRLPDEIERAASAHRVTVSVLARSSAAEETKLACSYSTAEFGNSGWRWFRCGPKWEIQSFEYAVPQMKNGNGDFIGFLSGEGDVPPVEVAAFSLKIA